jgi:hypothetical protein
MFMVDRIAALAVGQNERHPMDRLEQRARRSLLWGRSGLPVFLTPFSH